MRYRMVPCAMVVPGRLRPRAAAPTSAPGPRPRAAAPSAWRRSTAACVPPVALQRAALRARPQRAAGCAKALRVALSVCLRPARSDRSLRLPLRGLRLPRGAYPARPAAMSNQPLRRARASAVGGTALRVRPALYGKCAAPCGMARRRPVPVQMWQGRAKSWCRCGRAHRGSTLVHGEGCSCTTATRRR